jgi:multisite-specific tRNA:(cytosine-C5)-methyltransferase
MLGPRTQDGQGDDDNKEENSTPVVLKRFEWYPNRAAWQVDLGGRDLRNSELQPLQRFLIRETNCGSISRMEAVSMVPVLVLNPQPGDIVLDMCAAPGSKTGQLMERVVASSGAGAVVANDPDVKRARLMIHRTRTLATPSLVVTGVPGQEFPLLEVDGKAMHFDRVLCDVPCSGDGTLRKSHSTLTKWHWNHGLGLHILQLQLLKRGLELVKVGGFLVYSTCSLNPIENEVRVLHSCAAHVSLLSPVRMELRS